MRDEQLRDLQRQGRQDPAARSRFFAELDRRLLPGAGALTQETAVLIQRFRRSLHHLLRGVNGASANARVEPIDVARELARLGETHDRGRLQRIWIVGPPPYGDRNKRSIVLVVAHAEQVAIGAVAARPPHGPRFVAPTHETSEAGHRRWALVEWDSGPELLLAWAEVAPLRMQREVAERWGKRCVWSRPE